MPKAPATLYHYTNQSGLLGILGSNTLWATKIQYLNDASEFQLALDLASSVLARLINGEKNAKKRRKIEALQSNLRQIRHLNVCVCSLSARDDVLSQWRAYGGGTSGFAIGLDRRALEGQASKQGFELVQCIYDQKVQEELVERLVLESLDKDFNTQPSRIDKTRPRTIQALAVGGDFAKDFAQLAPKIKNGAFSEENEWRLVSARGVDVRTLSFRPGISMLTPYLPFSLGDELRAYLCSVTVGPTPHPDLAQLSTSMLLAKLGNGESAHVYLSNAPYRAW